MSEVKLPVPYLSQLDNLYYPYGTCNTTSVAMCLSYFGAPKIDKDGCQLEDELTDFCFNTKLDRHSPLDLKKLIERFGCKDDFQAKAKWQDVKNWLRAGNPCIVHGWFTRSGHIIAIVGFNDRGFIVHDPYGEWFSGGYDSLVSGEALTYSYEMMIDLCGPDGDLWIHYVGK